MTLAAGCEPLVPHLFLAFCLNNHSSLPASSLSCLPQDSANLIFIIKYTRLTPNCPEYLGFSRLNLDNPALKA